MATHLDWFAQPAAMTDPTRRRAALESLPQGLAELLRIVQGLVIYDVVAKDFYGFTVPPSRLNELHIRRLRRLLDVIFGLDSRSLDVSRPADTRVVGRCHHFVLLLVGMLRAKGIPARARCGFGGYFNPGFFEDHWVCEYWTASEGRWKLADPQFDEVWRRKLKIDHDVLDVPRDRFLVAGDAWSRCRASQADPSRFGIEFEKLRGLWFVAGNLVRDLASLNKVEMLPWDFWGAMPRPNETLAEPSLEFFDRIADRTRTPDDDPAALRALYEDDRLRVPDEVFNALLNREEPV
jgi:hypothetical protein